jgi:hypothetical protein
MDLVFILPVLILSSSRYWDTAGHEPLDSLLIRKPRAMTLRNRLFSACSLPWAFENVIRQSTWQAMTEPKHFQALVFSLSQTVCKLLSHIPSCLRVDARRQRLCEFCPSRTSLVKHLSTLLYLDINPDSTIANQLGLQTKNVSSFFPFSQPCHVPMHFFQGFSAQCSLHLQTHRAASFHVVSQHTHIAINI